MVLSSWFRPHGSVPVVLSSWFRPRGSVPVVLAPLFCPRGSVLLSSLVKFHQKTLLSWRLSLPLGHSLLWSCVLKPSWILVGGDIDPGAVPPRRVPAGMEEEEEERGRAVCVSHANLISAAVIESWRNPLPLPGETSSLCIIKGFAQWKTAN